MTASNSAHGTTYPDAADWRERAACLGREADMFPDRSDLPATLVALRVCAPCPVRRECLNWALDTDSRYGVFGGVTELDRRTLQTGRGTRSLSAWPPRVKHGTPHGFEAHRRRGQKPCESCYEGERAYRAEVKEARRLRKAAEQQEVAS